MKTRLAFFDMLHYRYYLMFALIVWVVVCMPSDSFARQPKATIKTLNGDVIVSVLGQDDARALPNMVLSHGDAIETYTGATAVLELSDGSTLELEEHTMIYFAVLEQGRKRAHASQLDLLWGRIRTVLSAGYQKKGSSFKIETLNASVNITLPQPNVETLYNPYTDTTFAVAHTVPLQLTNLFTQQALLIKPGHTGIVQGRNLEDKPQILQPAEMLVRPPTETPLLPNKQPLRELLRRHDEAKRAREVLRDTQSKTTFASQKTAHSLPYDPVYSVGERISGTGATILSSKKSGFSKWNSPRKMAIAVGGLAAIVGGSIMAANTDDDDDDDGESADDNLTFPIRGGTYHTVIQLNGVTGFDAYIEDTFYIDATDNGFSFETNGRTILYFVPRFVTSVEATYIDSDRANVTITQQATCGLDQHSETHTATTIAIIADGIITFQQFEMVYCVPDSIFWESWVLTPQ